MFLSLCIGLSLAFSLALFLPLNRVKKNKSNVNEGVSIIIAAKNEEENLKKNLSSFINQDYHLFEIIIVDDHSKNPISNIFQQSHKLSISLSNGEGKKDALKTGALLAKFQNLLFTDADCRAPSKKWIELMINAKSENSIVLGYSPYLLTNNPISQFLHFEGYHIALLYLGLAKKKLAYMGTGRNLLVEKQLFFQLISDKKYIQWPSGDDDLLIQIAVSNNIYPSICLAGNSFIETTAPTNFKHFYFQKLRHLSTGKFYSTQSQVILGAYHSINSFGYFLGILALVNQKSIDMLLFFVFLIVRFLSLNFAQKTFKYKGNQATIPLLDVLYFIYWWVFGILGFFYKPKKWRNTD